MKTIRLTVLLLFFAASMTVSADAPESQPDTVALIQNPDQIVITESSTSTTVTVRGRRNDPNFNFQYSVSADTLTDIPIQFKPPFTSNGIRVPKKRSYREITFMTDMYIGAIIPQKAPEAVRTSFDIGISNVVGIRYTLPSSGSAFGVGVGYGTKMFNIRRGQVAVKEGDALRLTDAPDGAFDTRSCLQSCSILIPFYYRQCLGCSLAFQLSVIGNLNVYTEARSKYSIGNTEISTKITGLHQRILTPEFVFSLGSVDFAGICVRWSPVKMFKRMYGPQITSLSIGTTISF